LQSNEEYDRDAKNKSWNPFEEICVVNNEIQDSDNTFSMKRQEKLFTRTPEKSKTIIK
jgi:hypothetical protein